MKETKALIRLVAFVVGLMIVLHCASEAMAGEWCDEWNTQTLAEKQAFMAREDTKIVYQLFELNFLSKEQLSVIAKCIGLTRESFITQLDEICQQSYSNPEQQMEDLYKAAIRRGISCEKATKANEPE